MSSLRSDCLRTQTCYRANAVRFANLVFEDCFFNSSARQKGSAIIEVEECSSSRTIGAVQFHHVNVRSNRLGPSSAIRVHSPSCLSLEMIDVRLIGNTYGAIGGAVLSLNNTLRDIEIRSNKLADRREDASFIFQAPSGAQTTADGINATENEGTLLYTVNGTLSLTNTVLTGNLVNMSREVETTAGLFLEETEATVKGCSFRNNSGGTSAVLNAHASNISLSTSVFERNNGIGNAGCLSVSKNSSISIEDCTFTSNNSTVSGGSAVISNSRFDGANLTFIGNSVGLSGGCIQIEAGASMNLANSSFEQNRAQYGASIVAFGGSVASVVDSTFADNEAVLDAGDMYVQNGNLSCTRCQMERASSTTGGFFYILSAQVLIEDSILVDGSAKQGGGIYAAESSIVNVQNTPIVNCQSELEGGGIYSQNTEMRVQNVLLVNGTSENGGCIVARDSGTLNVTSTRFENCSATAAGGAMKIESNVEATVANCTFSNSMAVSEGGGCHVSADSDVTLTRCRFAGSQSEAGGTLFIDQNSTVTLDRLRANSGVATTGGHIDCRGESRIRLFDTRLIGGSATGNGGCLHLTSLASALIDQSSVVASCNATGSGGAVFVSNSSLVATDSEFSQNAAEMDGGAVCGEQFGSVRINRSVLDANTARKGGAVSLATDSSGRLEGVNLTDNSAAERGGSVHASSSRLNAIDYRSSGSRAYDGGCLWLHNASASVEDSSFVGGRARGSGGCIFVGGSSSLNVTNVEASEGQARAGGCLALHSSVVRARQLRMGDCESRRNGGAVSEKGSSRFSCSECLFEDNEARGRGGAISVESSGTQPLALQLYNSTVSRNSADYGGTYISVKLTMQRIECCSRQVDCTSSVTSES